MGLNVSTVKQGSMSVRIMGPEGQNLFYSGLWDVLVANKKNCTNYIIFIIYVRFCGYD